MLDEPYSFRFQDYSFFIFDPYLEFVTRWAPQYFLYKATSLISKFRANHFGFLWMIGFRNIVFIGRVLFFDFPKQDASKEYFLSKSLYVANCRRFEP